MSHHAVEEALRNVLADNNAYIVPQRWLTLLQDPGTELSEREQTDLDAKRAEGKTKTFKKRILYGDRLHGDLYTLAEMVYITYEADDRAGKWFENLPKNKSETVHKIGQWIVKNRTRVAITDIQSHVGATDLTDVMKIEGYEDREVYYYLPQRDVIRHFFSMWGMDIKKLMKPTSDDILRLIGIMLTKEEMREYIPDILGKRRDAGGWQSIDAATGLARAVWPRLLALFIDSDVEIALPAGFNSEEMKRKVDERAGEGFFDEHGGFNPNNLDRIKLPWNESMLQSVLHSGRTDYEFVMAKYTHGTGGGPGAPENFADWESRHESWMLNYTPQRDAHLYLTIIFMWDKEHGFPLKPSVGEMPPGTGRDDEADTDVQINNPSTAPRTADKSTTQSKSSGSITTAIQHLTEARQKSTNALLQALVGGHANEGSAEKKTTDEQYETVGRIMDMRKAVKASEDDINESKKKRSRIEEKYADNPLKRSKKLKKINKEIEQQEKVKDTLKTTMMQYTAELARLNSMKSDAHKELDFSNDDMSSSSSSSESDDEL